jgi:UDP-glucose 4-epimerase
MNDRILVTGGAGFIGSHLVDALVGAGERVTVLDDFSTGSPENLVDAQAAGSVRIVTGSILDPATVADALQDCNRVYHLAVQCVRLSLGSPRQSHDVNATGSLTVLEAARRQRIARFVYCSSSEVYGNASANLLDEEATQCQPVTIYGAAKLAGELYAEAYRQTYGLQTLIVRPFNAYGPRAHERGALAEVVPRFVIRVLNGRPPVVFGDGSQGRDFTYVTDVARGISLAGASDLLVGRRVNIAFGRMLTIREIAATIMKVCGRNDLALEITAPRPGDVNILRADTKIASSVLGYRAKIAFEDGIRRYIEWFRKRHPDPSLLIEDTIENWTMPVMGAGTVS